MSQRSFRRRAAVIVAIAIAPLVPALHAYEAPDKAWSHKAWSAEMTAGTCRIWTGGDGAGTFEMSFETGGFDAAADYLPIVYSNYPLPLRPDDRIDILIDGRPSDFGSEMWFYDGPDAWGRYMVGAGLTGGAVPDLVAAFRSGGHLAIGIDRRGETPFVSDRFSLAGFTAAYLKISEWCRFDPDALVRS